MQSTPFSLRIFVADADPDGLCADYKGERYTATLPRDGQVSYARELYASPSAAARAVVGRAANGWRFWHYKKGTQWVPLAELRK